jgi:nicotinate-nucleotide adenylyltransferase
MEYVQTLTNEVSFHLQSNPIRVGLLGGTFDPVHEGHIDIAQKVYQEFSLSKIMLVLSGNPPHKNPTDLAPAHHRLNMLAIAARKYPFLEVSSIELNRGGVIYTVDTLTLLREQQPKNEFYFIIGSDTLFELETWKNIGEVFRLTCFICVRRPGDSYLQIVTEIGRLCALYGDKIKLSGQAGPDISSTDIRRAIMEGRKPVPNLQKEVEEYIDQYGLYK